MQDSKVLSEWKFGYPNCINKKQSRLVCLHQNCLEYPFFCSSCEDQSCEHKHQHDDKIISIGFKQYIKRVITQRKPSKQLQDTINGYKIVLQKLKEDINKFVQQQTQSADDILRKSIQLQEDEQVTVKKLKDKRYQELTGSMLDKVWNKIAPTPQKKKKQQEIIEFLHNKQQEIKQISQNFHNAIAQEIQAKNSLTEMNGKHKPNTDKNNNQKLKKQQAGSKQSQYSKQSNKNINNQNNNKNEGQQDINQTKV